MNVTVTHPISTFTGNVTLQDGFVVLSFTNGTCQQDVPPASFNAIAAAGLTLTIGAPSPSPPYDANYDGVTAKIVAASDSQTTASLKAAYASRWQANHAYAQNDLVLNPSGQIVQANAAFTSGASYDSSKWTVVTGGGSVSDATTTSKGIIQLAGDLAGTAAAPTVAKINGAAPAAVATSGSYNDLSNKPTIPTVGAAGTGGAALSATDPTTTNSRTPTAHASTHASGGTDPVTVSASQISATGTASATTYLRGDGSWATPAGGGGSASYPNNSGSATVVPRPMFIDVRDYGAKFGDGITDNTAAIQAALDAAVVPQSGVTNANDLRATIVQLPPGTAVLSGTLQIPANCWLRGHGPSATYLSQTSLTADTLNNKPSTVQVTISDLGIVQQGTPTAGSGIDLSNTGGASILGDSRNIIRDVVIVGTYNGVHNLGGSEGRMERVTVQRPVNIGVQAVATDYFISACTVGQPGQHGFYLDGANGRIWGCKVYGGGKDGSSKGFYINGSGRHELSACEVQDLNGDAYYFGAGSSTLTACASDSVAFYGFNLDYVGDITLTGCLAYNRTGGGAYSTKYAVRAFGANRSHIDVQALGGIVEYLTDGTVSTSTVSISNERGPQSVAYAATIAPNPFAGGSVFVGSITGDLQINGAHVLPNSPNERFHPGQRFAFSLPQDAVGGHAVAFDSTFTLGATAIPTTANSRTRIEFEWTGSTWFEVARTTI